ncbi:hypothetical protein EVAR_84143_1 [Eumeta japonica]|uniref:Uncharacterized protein n=1 Tax=Eumeta variegata TaxID=151549 RepID=A0A4C2A9V0_EUMVA|nr:hypothetical protein EVAR_84143_1 [Eumeta japonica]
MPIGLYLDRVRYVCSKLGTDKIILGATTWSVWWAANAMMRAVSISATSSILRVAHLERGQYAHVEEGTIRPRPLVHESTIRQRPDEFAAAMDAALNERTLTTEMVKSVGSCDQRREGLKRCAHKEGASEMRPRQAGSTWSGSMQARRSGRVSDLAETFSLMTVSILTIRIIRKSEGEPTGVVNHPKLLGICPGGPTFTGAEIRFALKHSTPKGPR